MLNSIIPGEIVLSPFMYTSLVADNVKNNVESNNLKDFDGRLEKISFIESKSSVLPISSQYDILLNPTDKNIFTMSAIDAKNLILDDFKEECNKYRDKIGTTPDDSLILEILKEKPSLYYFFRYDWLVKKYADILVTNNYQSFKGTFNAVMIDEFWNQETKFYNLVNGYIGPDGKNVSFLNDNGFVLSKNYPSEQYNIPAEDHILQQAPIIDNDMSIFLDKVVKFDSSDPTRKELMLRIEGHGGSIKINFAEFKDWFINNPTDNESTFHIFGKGEDNALGLFLKKYPLTKPNIYDWSENDFQNFIRFVGNLTAAQIDNPKFKPDALHPFQEFLKQFKIWVKKSAITADGNLFASLYLNNFSLTPNVATEQFVGNIQSFGDLSIVSTNDYLYISSLILALITLNIFIIIWVDNSETDPNKKKSFF